SSANAAVGTLTTTDADGADSHTYTLVNGAGDANNASFVIATNFLNVASSNLPAGIYSIRIQTDDGNGGVYAEAFSISVRDDIAPMIISITRKTPLAQVVG